MRKSLPKVFANIIDKEIKNNEKIYITEKEKSIDTNIDTNKKQNIKKEPKQKREKTIEEKINEIINKKEYVYKIPVEIETETNKTITKIIGKNKNNIITIDNELIKIDEIKNIKIKNE